MNIHEEAGRDLLLFLKTSSEIRMFRRWSGHLKATSGPWTIEIPIINQSLGPNHPMSSKIINAMYKNEAYIYIGHYHDYAVGKKVEHLLKWNNYYLVTCLKYFFQNKLILKQPSFSKASVTIVAGLRLEFDPPFLWRSKHQTKSDCVYQ